jgi:hypothetical protein
MQFSNKVQEIFKKAGWYPGRNVQEKFDAVPRFNEFPEFVKEFLYEYGDLNVETSTGEDSDVTGTLNLGALISGYFLIDDYLDENASFGIDLKTFPIGDYDLDNAAMECDLDGNIYMSSDFPNHMSSSFQEGIEKVILEDYQDAAVWDVETKQWRTDRF